VKRINLEELSVDELVKRFETAQLAQFQAELYSDIAKQNSCVTEAMAIAGELKRRPGDMRSALLNLYQHPNVQVRLMAARLTLAVAPATARNVIQTIADSKEYPQAGDAGMCLSNLDQGIFKPS
jgi:hypothetical protein